MSDKYVTLQEVVDVVDVKIEEVKRQLRVNNDRDIKVILYHYPTYKAQITLLNEEIKYLEEGHGYGLVHNYEGEIVDGTKFRFNEFERIQNIIETKKAKLRELQMILFKMDTALTAIEHDPWYPVVVKRFLENKTFANIAEELGCIESTATANCKRLLGIITSVFFV